jgi:hypothetical protein
VFDDLSRDLCPFNRTAVSNIVAIGVHEHVSQSRGFTRLDLEEIDVHRIAFRDSVLSSASPDYCVSHKRRMRFGGKAAQSSTEVGF